MKGYTLKDFCRFCSELKTEDGKPLEVEPFERRILRDHFAGAIEEVVILGKKNGKSTIFGALSLFHLENWPDPEVDIGASSRDQATILFNQAANMVTRSGLEDRFDIKGGYRHIRLRSQPSSRIRVLAADAKTADGVIPTLALVDELHRHPNGDLYGVFRDGLDARDGRMVTMSTAGAKEDSPLGGLRKKAQVLPSFKRKGAYSTARTKDGSFVLHEWSLTEDDDLHDLKLVKKANPASWQTIPKLRRRMESPAMTPGRWARFACGVWTEGEEPWLEPQEWDRLKVDIGRVEPGEEVFVAVAVGINPGLAIVANRSEGVAVKAEVFEGDPPLKEMEARLIELSHEYAVREVTWGQTQFQRSEEYLSEQGLETVEFPYRPARLSLASLTLKRLIQEKSLRHDGDPKLRSQVMAGLTKETEEGWRLVPSNHSRALIALAVACHRATQTEDPAPLIVVGSVG